MNTDWVKTAIKLSVIAVAVSTVWPQKGIPAIGANDGASTLIAPILVQTSDVPSGINGGTPGVGAPTVIQMADKGDLGSPPCPPPPTSGTNGGTPGVIESNVLQMAGSGTNGGMPGGHDPVRSAWILG